MEVQTLLPPSLRASVRVLRSHLVECLLQDAADTHRARRARWFSRIGSLALSPGRWGRRARRAPGAVDAARQGPGSECVGVDGESTNG